ncbi:MAG: DUF2953 domain-containing protein [Methanoregula sp.]
MDLLIIPAFIAILLIVPLLAIALLLYAVPIRAAATLIWNADRKEPSVLISWGCIGIRSTGLGAGRVTSFLILNHPILSRTGPAGEAEPVNREEVAGPEPTPQEEKRPEPGDGGTFDISELVPVVHRMIGPVGRFGSAFWQQSRFEEAHGTVTLGLGDPVLTGEAYGFYWASRFVLLASRIDVEMEPVFDRMVLELDITVRVKVVHPLLVLFAGLALAMDPATKEAVAYATRKKQGVTGA